jgi:hypothetical protein
MRQGADRSDYNVVFLERDAKKSAENSMLMDG